MKYFKLIIHEQILFLDIVPVYNYEAILEARQQQKKNRQEIRIGKKRRKLLGKKEDQENMFGEICLIFSKALYTYCNIKKFES